MRQEDEAGGPQDTGKAQEPEGSAEKAGRKKDNQPLSIVNYDDDRRRPVADGRLMFNRPLAIPSTTTRRTTKRTSSSSV